MFYRPQNRLAQFFPVDAQPPALPSEPPPPPSRDRLLADAHSIRLELHRCADDDGRVENHVHYELHGYIGEADGDILAAILEQFRGAKGGAA